MAFGRECNDPKGSGNMKTEIIQPSDGNNKNMELLTWLSFGLALIAFLRK